MAIQLWTPTGYSNPIAFIGAIEFRDVSLPQLSKNEWGIDVLVREVKGPAPVYADYLAKLAQGQTYAFNGRTYYLQSWEPGEAKVFPSIRMVYKGLVGGIPNPKISNQRISQSSTLATDNPYSATREIQYMTDQTTYRYISDSQPNGARYSSVSAQFGVLITKSIVTDGDGTVEAIPDGQLMSNLTKSPMPTVVGSQSDQVFGTPYWECINIIANLIPSGVTWSIGGTTE